MKKLLSLLLVFVTLISLSACSKQAISLKDIQKQGYIVIASEENWSPYTYWDQETNTLTGFDVELGRLIAAKLGVEARFEKADFDAVLAGVQSGRFNLGINGINSTPERAESLAFSIPYGRMDTVLIVNENNTDINEFEDLEGRICTNSKGSIYADWSLEYGADEANFKYVPTFGETAQLLINGTAEASINSLSAFNDYARAKKDAGQEVGIKIAAYADPENYVVCAQKSEATNELVEAIDNIITELQNDGTISALSVEFFGFDMLEAAE